LINKGNEPRNLLPHPAHVGRHSNWIFNIMTKRDIIIIIAILMVGMAIGYLLGRRKPEKEFHVIEVPKTADITDGLTGRKLNYYERLYATESK
jgi:hypothetical protein